MLNEYGPESAAIKTLTDVEAAYNTKRMAEDAQAKEKYEKDINKQKTSKAELDAELSALKAEKEATSKKIEEKKEQKKKYEHVISKQEELSKNKLLWPYRGEKGVSWVHLDIKGDVWFYP